MALIASLACAENPLAKVLSDAWSHSQSKDAKVFAQKADALIRSGDHEQARVAAQRAAATERAFGNVKAADLFKNLDEQLEVFIEFGKIRLSLPPDLRGVLEEFGAVARPISHIAVVPASVQPFLGAFRDSARTPDAYFGRMSPAQQEEASSWMKNSKRLFLAGAGADIERVKQIKKSYEAQGYSVFFYKLCEGPGGGLCDHAIVGGYFKSSTRSLVVNTSAAGMSPFVLPEIQMALAFEKGKTWVVMISPEQYRQAESAYRSGVQAAKHQMTAVVFTLADDPNQR